MEKEKVEVYKKWWFWVVILVIIIIIAITSIILINKQSKGIGSAGISKKEFEKIKIGMDNFEVNSIIDKLGEWNDDKTYKKACEEVEKTKNESVYTYTYKYNGETEGYALITFQVDYSDGVYGLKYPKVVKKEQFNLK